MKAITSKGRVKNTPAEERAGDAGTSPACGENETEADNRPPGAGDGAGQTNQEQARIAEVPEPGITGPECAVRDLRFRATRGWS